MKSTQPKKKESNLETYNRYGIPALIACVVVWGGATILGSALKIRRSYDSYNAEQQDQTREAILKAYAAGYLDVEIRQQAMAYVPVDSPSTYIPLEPKALKGEEGMVDLRLVDRVSKQPLCEISMPKEILQQFADHSNTYNVDLKSLKEIHEAYQQVADICHMSVDELTSKIHVKSVSAPNAYQTPHPGYQVNSFSASGKVEPPVEKLERP